MTSAADVLQMIKDNDCKYVDLRVTDLLGKEMHLTIPADKIDEDTFELGQPFDGSSFVGWRGIESSDMLLQPDPSTARMDPFREANTLVLNCDVFEGDWEAAWQVVQDAVSDIWDVISDRIRGAINNIIGFVNGMISAIVSGLNTVINGLNSLSFDAPSWVTDLTGISSFGFNIGTVTAPQIPYLAQGAVIPANREFLAVLGDQSHGTNVEAPLDTIKQAVAEVMEDLQAGQMAGFEAVVSVLREILSAVYGIELTDEDVGRAVQRWQRKQAIATGGV